jgi:hypothetical protein
MTRMLGITVIVLLLAACGGGTELELERAVAEARAGGDPVDLADLADTRWDRAAVFGPSTTEAEMERVLGIPPPARAERRLTDEGISLVIFVRGERVVAAAEVPRDVADFAETGVVLTPDEARFAVDEPDGDGPPLLRRADR